ncbi:MAG: VOC family protein [Rhodospirillales bacterium]|nr:VOC family protein [Rhodospirillales bacterium]
MSQSRTPAAPVIPVLTYADADGALDWLCRAFGFTVHAAYRGDNDKLVHAELALGGGLVMIGPWGRGEFSRRFMTLPADAGGRSTQTIYVVVGDANAHHAVAAAAGAEIVLPLKDEDYGGRGYSARDPEGHVWTFGTYDPWTAKQA